MALPSAAANANPRHFGVKRIMKEYAEFQKSTDGFFQAAPLEDNLFEWHFTLRGPPDSDFAGGRYHGRILLPSDYPFKPPDIMLLTPSGRFETNKKICLSISSFHPKNWQASWSIRTVLTALVAFFITPGNGAIGSLEYSSHERREYAARSSAYKCPLCNMTNIELLPGELDAKTGLPVLAKEVQDTIDANKSIPPIVPAGTVSQPGTPAQVSAAAPTATPSTPLNLAAAQRIVADAGGLSGPTTPAMVRTHAQATSSPSAGPVAGIGEMTPLPAAAADPSSAAASSTSATVATPASSTTTTGLAPAPLLLDEGLRQRQGRVLLPMGDSTNVAAPAAAPAVPAATAAPRPAANVADSQPVVVVQPAPAPANGWLTLLLAFLIVLILVRKLYAATQAKQAFGSYDFSQD